MYVCMCVYVCVCVLLDKQTVIYVVIISML